MVSVVSERPEQLGKWRIKGSQGMSDANTVERRRERAYELLRTLCETYPDTFFSSTENRKLVPLSIGIHEQIRARHPEIAKNVIANAMRIYTQRLTYQRALVRSKHRINLDGSQGGEVTEEQREIAQGRLQKADESRKQTTPAQRPQAAETGVSEDKLAKLANHFKGTS